MCCVTARLSGGSLVCMFLLYKTYMLVKVAEFYVSVAPKMRFFSLVSHISAHEACFARCAGLRPAGFLFKRTSC